LPALKHGAKKSIFVEVLTCNSFSFAADLSNITFMKLNEAIQYCVLQPTTTITEIENACTIAIEKQFAALCVPALFVKKSKELLQGSNVQVATVINYPLGYSATEVKLAEALLAILDGADELQFVANTMVIKNNDWQYIAKEINHLLPVIRERVKTVTVIFETSLLTQDELIKCCNIYSVAGIDFVQTATTNAAAPLSMESFQLIKQHLPAHIQLVAAGGIDNQQTAEQFVSAGAARIPTSHLL
jgi:deoxyribose-phosphate aldolase